MTTSPSPKLPFLKHLKWRTHFFLGFEIRQTLQGYLISQHRYIQELLESFQIVDCHPLTSPMDPNSKLSAHSLDEPVDATLYGKLVGSLIWLLNTHLDLGFSIRTLSSFMQKPFSLQDPSLAVHPTLQPITTYTSSTSFHIIQHIYHPSCDTYTIPPLDHRVALITNSYRP